MQAEGVLGGNENLYKIEWVSYLIFNKRKKKTLMMHVTVTREGDTYYPAFERR